MCLEKDPYSCGCRLNLIGIAVIVMDILFVLGHMTVLSLKVISVLVTLYLLTLRTLQCAYHSITQQEQIQTQNAGNASGLGTP